MICFLVMIPTTFHLYRVYKLMKAGDVMKARDTYLKSFIYLALTATCTFASMKIDNKHKITTKADEYEKFYE